MAHIVIVCRMLIGVAHDETNRTASCLSFEYSTQNLHLVSLLPICCYPALSRAAAVKFVLDELHVYHNACRHTVDDTTYSLSVAFAKCCQRE